MVDWVVKRCRCMVQDTGGNIGLFWLLLSIVLLS